MPNKKTQNHLLVSPVKEVVEIVHNSKRPMPAHFTDNDERTQSFCVNFFIDAKHEFQMASVAWEEALKTANKTAKEYEQEVNLVPIIKIGEDLMIGAYILEKKNGSKEIGKLIDALMQANQEWSQKEELIDSPEIREYFDYCWKYGLKMSREKMEEKVGILDGIGKFYTTDPKLRYV